MGRILRLRFSSAQATQNSKDHRFVGEELCSLEAPEDPHRQPPKRSAAIVLLDRCLDLCTPTQHSAHIVDRMFSLLPRPGAATADLSASSGSHARSTIWCLVYAALFRKRLQAIRLQICLYTLR